ncbi:MAG TPA: PKD domain-containing protein [Planctomycetota bacterium]|nr:PKD domain-containing protein [Planctomycetota bacterium]HRR81867.1 PKD domain-containing protein [Planctomycetota bacterium]HRT95034.1 PKD domain-containing protein [Planctomycetota bacterium]
MNRGALLLLLMSAAVCPGASVRLVVRNGAEADQTDAPVTLGVPWPAGALPAPDTLRLYDPAGAERPLQTQVLSRWPDGSVQWLLLDFQATVPRKGTANWRLDTGVAPRAEALASPLTVREDATQITVSTGGATFRLSKERFTLFDEVMLEGQERPLVAPHGEEDGLSLEPVGGRALLSSRGPARAEVETRGPVRVAVRLEGKFHAADGATLGDCVARLHFAAGRPAARLELTVLNRERALLPEGLDAQPLPLNDLTLRLPLRLDGLLKWQFAGERGPHPGSLSAPADHAVLVQECGGSRETCRYKVVQRGDAMGAGDAARGGVSLWGTAGGAAIAVRRFAANGPKALRVLGRPRIEVGLFPREGGPCRDFVAGRAKTHDLLLWFSAGEPPAPEALSAAFDGPLTATAALPDEAAYAGRWYAAAHVASLAPLGAWQQERLFLADLDRLRPGLEGPGAWGVWRYGSLWRQPFDPTLALASAFLRRGEPELLDAAHTAARHLADVATFHNVAGGDERLTGACLAPGSAGPSQDESWYAGAWLVFLLTGDRVVLDAALENAAFAARRADDPDTPPLGAALAALNLAHAEAVAPAFAPQHRTAFGVARDLYMGKLLEAQRRNGHGLHADRIAEAAIALEALDACQQRKPDPRLPSSNLRAAEALTRPDAFWSGHEKAGGRRAADGAAAKPYATADGLVADWARHPEAAVAGLPCAPLLPWLAQAAEATGDFRFLAKARRLERVASLAPCETPLDFALRHGDAGRFAAAWERYAQAHPVSGDPAVGLQCRLESAADVALPDAGVGGAALYRPFVALPDGTRACLAQSPGGPERPDAGVWFPFLDSPNAAETQGAIEFRLLCRKGPCRQGHVLLRSGDSLVNGFSLSLSRAGFKLVGRHPNGATTLLETPGVQLAPGGWHHVALHWSRETGPRLLLDGREVGRSSTGRLALTPRLHLPCDPKDPTCECLVRDLRIWRRPPEAFAAAADATPPAAVTDLLLAPAEGGRVLLSWTAPGDDGRQGQAAGYDVRFSTQPLRALSWGGYAEAGDPPAAVQWAEAERLPAPPRPKAPGQLEKLLIGPLPADRRVYIALRALDEAGNAAPLSSVVHSGVNHPPVADAGPPLRYALAGSAVLFDARDSSDPDFDELAYEWSHGVKGPTGAVRYDQPGQHEVTLTVSDGAQSATAATRVVVGSALRVNFQPRRAPRTPDGFAADEGLPYSRLRGYGWLRPAEAPGAAGFVRRQPAGLPLEASTGLAIPAAAEWLCDLPNGTYRITLAIGDPAQPSGRRRILAEGKEVALVDLAAGPCPLVLAPWRVSIADGQLNLRLEPASDPQSIEINYIVIERE